MRFIIHADDGPCLRAGARACEWLQGQPPDQRDAILTYGGEFSVYVRRNKASITAYAHSERTGT